ncbi:hypothetical protein [Streptomyces synnematoformans]|uniref:Uncharacterized protein n=1 Tax=Streptomyces synnematoformans TaxID=415721 RepID=A0ABP5IW69_9ACTN
MKHNAPHPQAGRTVTVAPAAAVFGHGDCTPFDYRIEDWNDRVFGRSWQDMIGNPAALGYAVRSATASLPTDNEVVYGHDSRGLGHLVHVSELRQRTHEEPAR